MQRVNCFLATHNFHYPQHLFLQEELRLKKISIGGWTIEGQYFLSNFEEFYAFNCRSKQSNRFVLYFRFLDFIAVNFRLIFQWNTSLISKMLLLYFKSLVSVLCKHVTQDEYYEMLLKLLKSRSFNVSECRNSKPFRSSFQQSQTMQWIHNNSVNISAVS